MCGGGCGGGRGGRGDGDGGGGGGGAKEPLSKASRTHKAQSSSI